MRRIPALALACCMALTSCAAPAKRIEPWGTPEEAARAARDILLEARKADQRITTDCLDIRSTRVFTIAEHPEEVPSRRRPCLTAWPMSWSSSS